MFFGRLFFGATSAMDNITLKHTDLNVSRICFGNMTFGGQTDKTVAAKMIDLCVDTGINFLDTANAYNGGAAEEMLGELLAGRRNKFVLASKVRNKMGDAPDLAGLSRAAIFRAIDDSLRRLRTDYLDGYYLHLPDGRYERTGETRQNPARRQQQLQRLASG